MVQAELQSGESTQLVSNITLAGDGCENLFFGFKFTEDCFELEPRTQEHCGKILTNICVPVPVAKPILVIDAELIIETGACGGSVDISDRVSITFIKLEPGR